MLDDLRGLLTTMADETATAIETLKDDVARLGAAVTAATHSISLLQDQLHEAIWSAASRGATPEQLRALADLHTNLGGDIDALNAAMAATQPVEVQSPTLTDADPEPVEETPEPDPEHPEVTSPPVEDVAPPEPDPAPVTETDPPSGTTTETDGLAPQGPETTEPPAA